MTFLTRPLARASIVCAAAALALSACSGKGSTEDPMTPTPSASASVSASAEATPAPGEWTLEDLKVGAKVPKEDLKRLFPKWEVPEPPATLTEFSEQGAKDAAIYYDRLADIAVFYNDPGLVDKIDRGECKNCKDIRLGASVPGSGAVSEPVLKNAETNLYSDVHNVYEVTLELSYPWSITMDSEGSTIRRIGNDNRLTLYTYLYFTDGQWRPIYVKLDEKAAPQTP